MKHLLTICLLLVTSIAFGQTWQVKIDGQSENFVLENTNNTSDQIAYPRAGIIAEIRQFRGEERVFIIKVLGNSNKTKSFSSTGYSYAQLIDDNGAAFPDAQAVITWFRDNTGNFKVGSGSNGDVTTAQLNASQAAQNASIAATYQTIAADGDIDSTNEIELPTLAVEGSLAVKGSSGWLAVPPGNPGQLLKVNATTNGVIWEDSTPSGNTYYIVTRTIGSSGVPTNTEIASPNSGDVAMVVIPADRLIETYTYDGTSWVVAASVYDTIYIDNEFNKKVDKIVTSGTVVTSVINDGTRSQINYADIFGGRQSSITVDNAGISYTLNGGSQFRLNGAAGTNGQVIGVNASGALEFKDIEAGGYDRVHAAEGQVQPQDTDNPDTGEIKDWNDALATPHKNTIIYYTGSDTATDAITYAYHVDDSGNITELVSPNSQLLNENNFSSNSTSQAATQASIKNYVDNNDIKVLSAAPVDGTTVAFEVGDIYWDNVNKKFYEATAASTDPYNVGTGSTFAEIIFEGEVVAEIIDSSTGATDFVLDAATGTGKIVHFVSADVSNEAKLSVASGESLNGTTDAEFYFSNYPNNTQFRADDVATGRWVVTVVGANQEFERQPDIYIEGALLDHTTTDADNDQELINLNTLVTETSVAGFDVDIANNKLNGATISGAGGLQLPQGTYHVVLHIDHPNTNAGNSNTVDNVGNFRSAIVKAFGIGEFSSVGYPTNLMQKSHPNFWVGEEEPPASADILETTKVETVVHVGDGQLLYFTLRSAVDTAGAEDFAVRISCYRIDSGTETILAGKVPVEDIRVLLGSGTGMTNNTDLTISDTWGNLAADYESIEFELITNSGNLNLKQNVSLSTANWTDGTRAVFVSDDLNVIVVRNMDITGSTANLYLEGTGTTNANVNVYGIKAQKTVINTAQTPVNDQGDNGYIDIGTVRIQWGSVANGSVQVVTLPAPFANNAYNVVATANSHAGDNVALSVQIGTKTVTGFDSKQTFVDPGAGSLSSEGYSWQAIGLKP